MGDIADEAVEAGLAALWSSQNRCVDCNFDCYNCPYPREIYDDGFDDDYDDW